MGICPCRRDNQDKADRDKTESLPSLLCRDAASSSSESLAGFHTNEILVREVEPLAAYYRIIAALKPGSLLRAEYVGSQQPCIIRVVSKTVSPVKGKEHLLRALLQLDNPYALKIYEVCQDSTNLYVVMEPFEGGELCDYLEEQGYLLEKSAAQLMYQVLICLRQCHQLGLVHRALDLQALVLKEEPRSDMLSIRVSGFENFDLMHTSSEYQPSCFTAPEVLTGHFTEKSDIWSCGVLLYVLLSGRNPFEDYESSSVSQKLKDKGFSFPPAIWSHVSQDAIDLIMLMMNKRAEARPSAQQCLAHPWIRHYARIRSLSSQLGRPSSIDLRAGSFSLRKAILYFMINRVIEESELSKLSTKFTSLDTDCDGLITSADLLAYFRSILPAEQAEEELKKALTRVSPEDGQVDYSEFLLACFSAQVLLSHSNLKLAFDALDRDGSGKVSTLELRNFFRIQTTEGLLQWKELTEEFDSSGEGEIDFSNFEALISKALKE